MASRYAQVLKLARRGNKANDKESAEVLGNLYDIFGRDQQEKARRRSAALKQGRSQALSSPRALEPGARSLQSTVLAGGMVGSVELMV